MKTYNYAVQSAGNTAISSVKAETSERATQEAAWAAQASACETGWEFDLLNFIIAVRAK